MYGHIFGARQAMQSYYIHVLLQMFSNDVDVSFDEIDGGRPYMHQANQEEAVDPAKHPTRDCQKFATLSCSALCTRSHDNFNQARAALHW